MSFLAKAKPPRPHPQGSSITTSLILYWSMQSSELLHQQIKTTSLTLNSVQYVNLVLGRLNQSHLTH